MANHTIVLTTAEETIYQKYLAVNEYDEATVVAYLKSVLVGRVLHDIDERGAVKFAAMTPAEKVAFLES
jgi:hypothetical protein